MPKSLDLDRLKRFEPSPAEPSHAPVSTPAESSDRDRWPSREPVAEGQISIKGPLSTIRRFKALCKDDRRTYADMLDILMTRFEER
jgi:hypothetical protein